MHWNFIPTTGSCEPVEFHHWLHHIVEYSAYVLQAVFVLYGHLYFGGKRPSAPKYFRNSVVHTLFHLAATTNHNNSEGTLQ